MFSRLSQLSRHLSRPLPNLAHPSAATLRRPSSAAAATMTSAGDHSSRTIHTAACLVIGDEVLGGKAGSALVCVKRRVGADIERIDKRCWFAGPVMFW